MSNPVRRLIAPRAMTAVAAALLSMTACVQCTTKGNTDKPTPPDSKKLIHQLRGACDGILQGITRSKTRDQALKEELKIKSLSHQQTKEKLLEHPSDELVSNFLQICNITTKDGSETFFDVTVDWSWATSHWHEDRTKNLTYRQYGSYGTSLDILNANCEIPATEGNGEDDAIKMTMTDDLLTGTEYRHEVLLTAAEKLTSTLGCKQEIDFSNPYFPDPHSPSPRTGNTDGATSDSRKE